MPILTSIPHSLFNLSYILMLILPLGATKQNKTPKKQNKQKTKQQKTRLIYILLYDYLKYFVCTWICVCVYVCVFISTAIHIEIREHLTGVGSLFIMWVLHIEIVCQTWRQESLPTEQSFNSNVWFLDVMRLVSIQIIFLAFLCFSCWIWWLQGKWCIKYYWLYSITTLLYCSVFLNFFMESLPKWNNKLHILWFPYPRVGKDHILKRVSVFLIYKNIFQFVS